MKRETEIALLEICLELMAAGQPPATEEETLIPVDHYRDPDRHRAEIATVFASQLNVVAHSCEIRSSGDFITRDVLGQPVLVVRDEAERARAFLNVCRHRGATVELRDRGHCKRFVCPYHAWTYATDGKLAAVRHKRGFPHLEMESAGLVELACHELGGLVSVCPDPALAELEPEPSDHLLADELSGVLGDQTRRDGAVVFAREERVYRANYKLIVDGGLESYHFRVAHRDTVAPFFADNVHHYERIGRHIRTTLPRVDLPKIVDRPREAWRIRELAHLVYSVAPNASVLVQKGHFELIVTTPLAVDETRVVIHTIVPDPGADGFDDEAQAFWSANHAFTKATLEEDFLLAEQIQRGIATGANTHFRFATFEGALTSWHARLEERLAASEATDLSPNAPARRPSTP